MAAISMTTLTQPTNDAAAPHPTGAALNERLPPAALAPHGDDSPAVATQLARPPLPSEHGPSTDPIPGFGFARACLRSPYPTTATTITTHHQVRQTLEGALDLRGQASAELPMRPFG